MSKTIKTDKAGTVHLNSFKDCLDISKVEFYSVKANKDKTITLKFYDKNKKLVKPYKGN